MPRTLALLGLAVLVAAPAAAQSLPAFEAADVRVTPPLMAPNPGVRPGAIRNGTYEIGHATMLDLIRIAYRVEGDKILGGPSWLEADRFDVVAKVPPSATIDTARPMLQALLADRFKLVVKQEKREMNTWVLSEASPGSARLLRSQGGAAPGCQGQPEPPNVKATCRNLSMIGFINVLTNAGRSYHGGSIITNLTGLTGEWDFELMFTQDSAQLKELGAQGISLFDALEKQLGLKLEQKTITVDSFNVVSVNRTPAPNPAGTEKILPPKPAPEFEVVDLKPSPPGDQPSRAQVLPTGQINAVNMPLQGLLNLAWGFNSNELLIGPKWLETARFDVIGKAFSGADAQFVDDEFLRLALRKLLVDRFQIKWHYEERPINAYALMPGPHKMTRADPSTRTRCYNGVPPGAKDPRQATPSRGALITCENATMQYFLDRMRGFGGGYIQVPAVDMTGLEGGWTFTLNWSGLNLFPGGVDGLGGRAGGAGDAGAAPAIPTGAITLPEAVQNQLGLRLEMGKRPRQVVVIDSMLEKPSDN